MIILINTIKLGSQTFLRNTSKQVSLKYGFNLFIRHACNISQEDKIIGLWILAQYFEVLNEAKGHSLKVKLRRGI